MRKKLFEEYINYDTKLGKCYLNYRKSDYFRIFHDQLKMINDLKNTFKGFSFYGNNNMFSLKLTENQELNKHAFLLCKYVGYSCTIMSKKIICICPELILPIKLIKPNKNIIVSKLFEDYINYDSVIGKYYLNKKFFKEDIFITTEDIEKTFLTKIDGDDYMFSMNKTNVEKLNMQIIDMLTTLYYSFYEIGNKLVFIKNDKKYF